MKKIGILTYHFSNNFGGVLQSYSLYKYLKSRGVEVEVIDYVNSNYKNNRILNSSGLKEILKVKSTKEDHIGTVTKRVAVKFRYNKEIIKKFDSFRKANMQLSMRVNENNIEFIINNYSKIIVGSDQIWNPGQRNKKEYFLGFGDQFKGERISYAADSTISEVDKKHQEKLSRELSDFDYISVRNTHSEEFVNNLTDKPVNIVVDPTLLHDFKDEFIGTNHPGKDEEYILVYVLGKELNGTNKKAIEKIKKVYGNIKVYAINIPTMKFNFCNYADEVLYDLGPEEWVEMIRNAKFVFTDSFHGTLFALKFHKPFLAYYKEVMRATRFIDLGQRYGIDKYIINSIEDIEVKGSLDTNIDFTNIDKRIEEHKEYSINFLGKALNNEGINYE